MVAVVVRVVEASRLEPVPCQTMRKHSKMRLKKRTDYLILSCIATFFDSLLVLLIAHSHPTVFDEGAPIDLNLEQPEPRTTSP